MKLIDANDLGRLKSRLNININEPELFLQNVIKIDDHYNLRDLFYKYFYISNDLIRNLEDTFFRSLDDNCQFKIIHGYSKNGKTTFINHILYRHENMDLGKSQHFDEIHLVHFDFEKAFRGNYIDKLKYFFIEKFLIEDPKTRELINLKINEFDTFIIKFHSGLKEVGINNVAINIHKTLSRISGSFQEYLHETQQGYKGSIHEIEEVLENKVISKIDVNNCGDYFIFLIFWELFLSKEKILSESKCKFVFTLDNIDDFLVHKDVLFMQYPQIHLSSFLYLLSSNPFISKIFLDVLNDKPSKYNGNFHFSFQMQISIVYIFRTANFLVFSNLINKQRHISANSSEKHFSEILADKEYVHLRTIGNTSTVLKHRLLRYEEICKKLEMKIPNSFYFLKTLAENFESTKTENFSFNIRRVFNLWNGDKSALWNSIIKNWDQITIKYFKNVDFILNLQKKGVSNGTINYILKGVYINFFLFLLKQHNGLDGLLYNSIYSFHENYNIDKKKNLRRIIINCIINGSLINGKPTCINEINKRGIGLYDLLQSIMEYIDKVNSTSSKKIYEFSELEDYFEEMCDLKIDHFAQLFCIYKDQVLLDNEKESISNYYNLNEEIKRFKNERINCRKELNEIRIYSNHSALYISASLMTSFELSSHLYANNEVTFKLPLLFYLKKINTNKEAFDILEFSFYEIIEKVYEQAEIAANSMIEFYTNHLIKYYDPVEFIKNPLFTVLDLKSRLGDFQTRLLISRHITYIQDFRNIALNHNDGLINLTFSEKILINKYLLEVIKKYCILFNNNIKKIEEIYAFDSMHILIRTKSSFNYKINEIDKILDSAHTYFNLLSTEYDVN